MIYIPLIAFLAAVGVGWFGGALRLRRNTCVPNILPSRLATIQRKLSATSSLG
jgi:hypothetical protein